MAGELIYKKLNDVRKDIPAIGKDGVAPSGAGGYKFRGIDAIMTATHDALCKHGILITQEVLEVRERFKNKSESMTITELKVKHSFIAEDGSEVSAVAVGQGADSLDKGASKAMTDAFKRNLSIVLHIHMPGEFEDIESADEDMVTDSQLNDIKELAKALKLDKKKLSALVTKHFGTDNVRELTEEEAGEFIKKMEAANKSTEDVVEFPEEIINDCKELNWGWPDLDAQATKMHKCLWSELDDEQREGVTLEIKRLAKKHADNEAKARE